MTVYFREVGSSYLQSIINAEKWEFLIYKSGQTWTGEISKADLDANASDPDLGQEYADYERTAVQVFSSADCSELCIDLEDGEEGIIMSWKKIKSSSVKYCLGSVLLRKCVGSGVEKMLKNVATTITKLRNSLNESQKEVANAEAENQRLACLLEKFSEDKVHAEADLFAKFVLILNEKKAKIISLKNEIEKLQNRKSDESKTANTSVLPELKDQGKRSRKKAKTVKPPVPTISNDDSLSSGDLEESLAKLTRSSRRKRNYKPRKEKIKQILPNLKVQKVETEPDQDDTLDASAMIDQL